MTPKLGPHAPLQIHYNKQNTEGHWSTRELMGPLEPNLISFTFVTGDHILHVCKCQ